MPEGEAKRGLKLLKEAGKAIISNICISISVTFLIGMKKINFSGGEPFIHKKGKYVGNLVKYCKVDLKIASVTIVSNGSLLTEEWFQNFGKS